MPKNHIKQIKVVSNTHWDREFRRSFEKTRRNLLVMMDTVLDILDKDSEYHSFTLDGQSILLDDYLELRPENRKRVERFIQKGRLVAGPYFTLAEEFSISHEALIRNLIWGRKTLAKYGGKPGSVAYTPSSWGQTGQLPQILVDFGLNKMMFYRGISWHETKAEYLWEAPDGTRVLASRFAVYARYNWYYMVHRAVTRGKVFDKDYRWGQYDEIPFRIADDLGEENSGFELKDPALQYDKSRLKEAIDNMIDTEGDHFTTEIFLAMNGHDISVAHPLESQIIKDAQEVLGNRYTIEQTSLEKYWAEMENILNQDELTVLVGERRSYLKEGMWTNLFPGTISARTYLKQKDFIASAALVYSAEPFASLAFVLGSVYPKRYLERGWRYLLSNHTHDANGGCAPDSVCLDMEYRYRKVGDISDIIVDEAMAYIACHLSPVEQNSDVMQLIVYNPLPFARDAVVLVDAEIPRAPGNRSFSLQTDAGAQPLCQPVTNENSSIFVDNIWDVPTIFSTNHIRQYVKFENLPALGYRTYRVQSEKNEIRSSESMVTRPNQMENEYLVVTISGNGTATIQCKKTGKIHNQCNYLLDQGEAGSAWQHKDIVHDQKFNSLGVSANIAVLEEGPLVGIIRAAYDFFVPESYSDETRRSSGMVPLPVEIEYRLEKDKPYLQVRLTVINRAKDHWLRAIFPADIKTNFSWADSHFDVVARPVPLPDSTGWIEQAKGTHPLRTFVDLHNDQEGFALITKGLYEYEVFDDKDRNLALSLIRACRIKLMVSEEKQAELKDEGIQCPGKHIFEYALYPHQGSWSEAHALNHAAAYFTPVRCAMSGRGKGSLSHEYSFISLDNLRVHITCIKQSDDGKGIIIRLFNPTISSQLVNLNMGEPLKKVSICRMDESIIEALPFSEKTVTSMIESKKIKTFKIEL